MLMNRFLVFIFLLLTAASVLPGQEYPRADISNGVIQAVIYLPDAEKGFYRATRFDWSGVIYSLKYKGHEYFGPQLARHDPLVSNSITGPVEAFETTGLGLGYDQAKPGSPFIRIGVGLVERPTDPSPRSTYASTFKILDHGKWTIKKGANWVEFKQELPDKIGYGYIYTKRITLTKCKPEMTISHSMKNTGAKLIDISQYNHNYTTIDRQPAGPGFVYRFPYPPRATQNLRGFLEVRGHEIHFLKGFQGSESAGTDIEGYGPTAKDHEFSIENQNTGAGMKVTADRPLSRLYIYSRSTTVCAEPFIHLRIEPGQTDKWERRYQFYTLK